MMIPGLLRSSGVALLVGAAVAAPPAQQPQTPVFGDQVELVSVDVLVLDEHGDPAEGLTQQDFTVEEDGVVQSISSFEAIRFEESAGTTQPDRFIANNIVAPVRPEQTFLVVFDDVHLGALSAERAVKEFEKLLAGLAPGDTVTVLTTSNRRWWTARLPEGHDELVEFAQEIHGLKPMDLGPDRISDWEAMQIAYGRDSGVLGMVARRYFENGLIAEIVPPASDPNYLKELEVSPGLPLIRAKATQVYDEAARSAAASMEVMMRAAASLGTQRGRKAMLVLSDGFFYDSTRTELRDLVRAARQANAVLYFFDARGRTGPDAPSNAAEHWRYLEERDVTATANNFAHDSEGTESAAYDTGGRVIQGTDDLAGPMLQVVAESRNYYLLGYASSNRKRDGKFRNIKVRVDRPGVQVRARKGYYAPSDKEEKKVAEGDPDPRVRAGLDSPFDSGGIPIRMAVYVFGSEAEGKATALLAADLDVSAVSFTNREGRHVGALESYALVTSMEPGAANVVEKRIDLSLPDDLFAHLRSNALPILRNFELTPGRYQARLLVRDADGSAVGTARHTFEVPPAGSFHLSTPVLSDTLTAAANGTQLPVPLARRRFASGSRLIYAFDVFGAKSNGQSSAVAISYVVRRSDGSIFSEFPAREVPGGPDGSMSHSLVLSLAGAQPGEYELDLTVEDRANGDRLERRDAFVVDPPA